LNDLTSYDLEEKLEWHNASQTSYPAILLFLWNTYKSDYERSILYGMMACSKLNPLMNPFWQLICSVMPFSYLVAAEILKSALSGLSPVASPGSSYLLSISSSS
jgi:hypothetical protein